MGADEMRGFPGREAFGAKIRASSAIPQHHGLPREYDAILVGVVTELGEVSRRFPPRNSMHEGWALLREEVDELWDEVKAGDVDRALAEAQQVAVSALRFIHDIQALRRKADGSEDDEPVHPRMRLGGEQGA
ncbi:hypothetical protein OG874_00235 [Nocardia sp. NBC_00565]|uniref:hypothetical protein n=1 Tax=Nocardia sp. NBC_00565 TaxID=2975993 RepID=UPI002E81C4C3|nr:hypothetical protein [Nocardia sp. NBC_00565]WUC03682.1 hypothetical protein OG874_00235 [Nocardia sp. NBC_00565]